MAKVVPEPEVKSADLSVSADAPAGVPKSAEDPVGVPPVKQAEIFD